MTIATIVVDPSLVPTKAARRPRLGSKRAPLRLARAFAPFMAPGDPNGATLTVQVSQIALGAVGGATGAIDTVEGAATLKGGGATEDGRVPPPARPMSARRPDPVPQRAGQRKPACWRCCSLRRELPGKPSRSDEPDAAAERRGPAYARTLHTRGRAPARAMARPAACPPLAPGRGRARRMGA